MRLDVRRQPQRHRLRQRHVPLLAALGRREHQFCPHHADLAAHVDDAAEEVDVIDGQPEYLALAHGVPLPGLAGKRDLTRSS